MPEQATPSSADAGYTVLARRYRPQRFEDFVGQEAVIRTLKSAIERNRVAHAYLFTGARGVGKTSMARMFARALNCVRGPTIDPCGECDQCQAITAGQDVDVLEIDGASNNGVENIRELRQAVHYRPTRSRYKIYIIDEVHMVTTAAFNALLKTLEEPPPHVKFLFATTEAQKIPITILSRCQPFSFGGIDAERIAGRLREIVDKEGIEVEDEALELVARRAGGSMRDSLSLLDQLLAYGGRKLVAADVHEAIGSANEERVRELAGAMLSGDSAAGLRIVETGVADGVQLGEWVEQLLDYFRDLMVLGVDPEAKLVSMPNRLRQEMLAHAAEKPPERMLEILDLLAACRSRMKASTYGRTLLEMAVVRVCRLDAFLSLNQAMLAAPSGAAPPAAPPRPAERTAAASVSNGSHNNTVVPPSAPERGPPPSAPAASSPTGPLFPEELTPENVGVFWDLFLARITDPVLVGMLRQAEKIELRPPSGVAVVFPRHKFETCNRYAEIAAPRIEQACREVAGRQVRFLFEAGTAVVEAARPSESLHQLRDAAERDPIVKRTMELLGAKIIDVARIERKPVAAPVDAAPETEKDDA